MVRSHRFVRMLLMNGALVASAATVMAAPSTLAPGTVYSASRAYVVVTDDEGKESFVEAGRIKFGDVVEYRTEYRNTSRNTVTNVIATVPVPDGGFEYVSNTAQPGSFLASLDGKTFAPPPLTRAVTLPDGRSEMQLVPESEYRSLRWRFGTLRPGATVTAQARVKLAE